MSEWNAFFSENHYLKEATPSQSALILNSGRLTDKSYPPLELIIFSEINCNYPARGTMPFHLVQRLLLSISLGLQISGKSIGPLVFSVNSCFDWLCNNCTDNYDGRVAFHFHCQVHAGLFCLLAIIARYQQAGARRRRHMENNGKTNSDDVCVCSCPLILFYLPSLSHSLGFLTMNFLKFY